MTGKEKGDAGLLDALAAECGCAYLSDLRLAELAPALLQAVHRIPVDQWTENAWRETAYYITGERDALKDGDGARTALERWLHK